MPGKHSTTFTGYVSDSTLLWMLDVIARSITAEHPQYKFIKSMAFRSKLSLDHFDTLNNVFLEFWDGVESPFVPNHEANSSDPGLTPGQKRKAGRMTAGLAYNTYGLSFEEWSQLKS